MKIFFLLLLCILAIAQAVLLKADEGGPLAARVNGTPITQYRLDRYFSEYLNTQNRPLTSIRSPNLYQHLREQALDQLIDKELLWQEAQRRNILISDTTVQAHIDQLQQALGGAQRFEQALADAGFDHVSFANYTRHELAAQQVYLQSLNAATPAQNHLRSAPVEREQQRALATHRLTPQAPTQQTLLQRLRADSRIERIDAR